MTTFTDTDTKAEALAALNANFTEVDEKLTGEAEVDLDIGTADVATFKIGGVTVTPTAAELNFVDGVTSAIQTQLNAKAALASPTFTGTPAAPTASGGTNTTQLATTAFVRGEIATLIGTAPGTLDTLGEISDALNDDANLAATITTSLAAKAPIASPTFTGTVTAPAITLPTNGQILLTVPTTDGHATGPKCSAFNSGYSSSAVGDLVYLDASATWQKFDANTPTSALLGIALAVAASGVSLLVALPGSFIYATAFPTLTVGGAVYASETAGAITQTAPTTTDAGTRVIGQAVHADKIFFNPSQDYTTHV